jgi:hypothetical protein
MAYLASTCSFTVVYPDAANIAANLGLVNLVTS